MVVRKKHRMVRLALLTGRFADTQYLGKQICSFISYCASHRIRNKCSSAFCSKTCFERVQSKSLSLTVISGYIENVFCQKLYQSL